MAMILRKWIRAKLETLGVVKDMMVYQVAETEKTIFFVKRIGSMLVWRAHVLEEGVGLWEEYLGP